MTTKKLPLPSAVNSCINQALLTSQKDSTEVKRPMSVEEFSRKMTSETIVTRLDTAEQVLSMWEAIALFARKADLSTVLQTALRCVQTGGVFIITSKAEFKGFSCVEAVGYGAAVIHSLPKDEGEGFGRIMVKCIAMWARTHGITELRITSTNFNGSANRYFEKCLGFRRCAVTFTKEI
jgi:hypothetical protein